MSRSNNDDAVTVDSKDSFRISILDFKDRNEFPLVTDSKRDGKRDSQWRRYLSNPFGLSPLKAPRPSKTWITEAKTRRRPFAAQKVSTHKVSKRNAFTQRRAKEGMLQSF